MSVRVTDPTGVEWSLSRDWFGVPQWARSRDDLRPADIPLGDAMPHIDSGTLAVIFGFVIVVLIVAWFLVPIFVLLLGVLVATAALVLRLLSISAWTVRATSDSRGLAWRVRGLFRSRRAIHELARKLSGGEEPLVEGRPPDAVASSV